MAQPSTYQAPVYEQVQPNLPNLSSGSRRTEVIKDSYIADEFMDYTSKAEPSNLNSKFKGDLKQSGTIEKEVPQSQK